jgi:flagellar motor switch protein FliN/FliY
MADDNLMNQSDIERLLSQGAGAAKPAPPPAANPGADQPLGQAEIESLLSPPGAKAAAAKPAATATVTDGDKLLAQDDIENLLNQAGKTPAAPPPAAAKETAPFAAAAGGSIAEKDIEFLLNQAEQALESINSANSRDLPQGIQAYRFEELSGAPASTETATLDLIRDVELDLKIELGRTQMYLEDVLKLRRGSVVPLDKLAGDPVDIYVNGRLIARGEVLVLNDNFCVRVAELIAGANVGA